MVIACSSEELNFRKSMDLGGVVWTFNINIVIELIRIW